MKNGRTLGAIRPAVWPLAFGAALLAALAGCGGSNDGGNGEKDYNGTWAGTLTNVSACGGPTGGSSPITLVIVQSGSQLTVHDPDPQPLIGSVNGRDFEVSRQSSLTSNGCTETATATMSGTLSIEADDLLATLRVDFSYAPAGCAAPCTSTFTLMLHRA
jgi:hypothetical protein